jgi:hypothetical protein
MANWLLNGDDPNRTLRFGEPLKNLLLRGKKVRDDKARTMTIGEAYTPASEFPNHILFGFEPAEEGFQFPMYFVPGSEMVTQSMDPETGNLRTVTQTIVATGTAATATDNSGSYSEVQSLDPNWMIKSVREAAGLAGDAANGLATRQMPRPMRHYWPPVLSGIYVRPVYTNPSDIYSEVSGYITYPIWKAYGYNGGCKGTLTEQWTKVKPSYTGNPSWPTSGSEPYIPEPTKLLPRPVSYQGTQGFSISIESCLHPAFIFTDSGFVMRDPATTPVIWPGTIILDVDVRPYLGGYLTSYVTLDAPSTLDTGLNLSHSSVSTTSQKVTWDVAGASTVLDVSTSPDFLHGSFLTGQAVPSSGTLEYTITGLTRGQLYFARLRRNSLTSNMVQFICDPQSELALYEGSTAITTTLAFATTAVGVANAKTLTVFNLGVLPLNVTSIAVSGTNAAEFVVSGAPTLVAAGNGQEDFTLTWTPTATDSRTATLTVTSDDDDSPLTIALSGTATDPEINLQYASVSYASGSNVELAGTVAAGTSTDYTITIQNTGTGNLTLGTTTIDGTGWSIVTAPTSPVAGGGSTTCVVRLTPTVGGASVGTLTVPSNDASEPTYTLALVAEVTATPEITVTSPWGGLLTTGNTVHFGRVVSGARPLTFTVGNAGYENLTGLVVGGSGTGWSIGAISVSEIAPGGTATVVVTFTTYTADATFTGTLTIASDDADEPLFTVNLSIIQAAAATSQTQLEQPTGTLLTTGVSSIDFGNVLVTGGTQAKTFTYRNTGRTTSGTLAGTVSGTHSAEFVQAGLVASAASTVGTIVSDDFTVTFDPAGFGARTATLTVTDTTDTPSVDFAVTLTGTGIPANALVTGQAAGEIIGQLDADDQDTVASSIVTPGPAVSAVSSAGRLAVADESEGKVYIWNTVPTASGTPADIVLLGNTTGVSGFTPSGVAWHGVNLWVSDKNNHRLLRYTNPSSASQNASLVLGQADFSGVSANRGGSVAANTLNTPRRLMVRGSKLIVADWGNNRVLIWNAVPTSSGTNANVAVGQANLTSNSSGTTATTLNGPYGVAVTSAGKLVVADQGNSRILQYANIPTTSGATASLQQGQSSMTSGSANRGGAAAANTLSGPRDVACHSSGGIAIADYGNNRVILFYDTPSSSGGNAHAVLGQADFTTTTAATSSASVMTGPSGLAWNGTSLLVSGVTMKRTMKFSPA